MNNAKPPHKNQQTDPHHNFEREIFDEYLRQNKQTFNMNLVGMAASLAVTMVGIFVMTDGKTVEGSVTTTAGSGGLALCCKQLHELNKESAKKLEKWLKGSKAS